MDYHTLLLTNFSAFIGQQIVFVPLLLINLLSSIKTIVLIVVNTSLLTQTIRRWMKSTVMRRGIKTFRWRMKSSKISKWRNASKKVGDHCYRIMFSFGPPQLDNLALNKTKQQTENWSGPCKHCALYGCYENRTNPWSQPFHISRQKLNRFRRITTWRANYAFMCDLRDMQSTLCWPNSKHIFQEMVQAPRYLKQTR